jgi:chorismate-pyruvate lyase
VPQATLSDHPWIKDLGETALGEALEMRGGVRRTKFAYARLSADVPLVGRALARAGLSSQPLWVRRSRFFVEGGPLLVQEVFFPHTGAAD